MSVEINTNFYVKYYSVFDIEQKKNGDCGKEKTNH